MGRSGFEWDRLPTKGTGPPSKEIIMHETNNGRATSMGMVEGFDYDRFGFSDEFPIPASYVVAYGMAHFRGPDGHLWFAPDNGTAGVIEWAYPQNVREFDVRQHGEDNTYTGPNYQAVLASIAHLVDEAIAATARYTKPIKPTTIDPTTNAVLPADFPDEERDTAGSWSAFDLTELDWSGQAYADLMGAPLADTPRRDNTLRAGRALAAVQAHADEAGGAQSEPVSEQISSLLSDLMHLADALGEDFAGLIEDAHKQYGRKSRGES